MNIDELKKYCRSLPFSIKEELGNPSNLLSYKVLGKKFAYFKTSEPERWRFSFRATPERFLELTDQPGMKPARYMHRFHWVTIVNVASVDKKILKQLVHWSFSKAVSRLPKKQQAQINL